MKRNHYKNFILKYLLAGGGSMERRDVIRKFEDKFLHGDGKVYLRAKELGDRGADTYWGNELSFARNELKDEGLLKNNSPNGLWELTRDGAIAAGKLPEEDFALYIDAPQAIVEEAGKITDPETKRMIIRALLAPFD